MSHLKGKVIREWGYKNARRSRFQGKADAHIPGVSRRLFGRSSPNTNLGFRQRIGRSMFSVGIDAASLLLY